MFLFSLRFSEVFWVIFLRSKGLSFAMIGLLEAVFHITSMSGEVPTGIIADRYGRKVSLTVGRFLAALSGTVILLARDWPMLAAAFALNALSYNCHSGAYEALVYDNMSPKKRAEFSEALGKINSIYLVGTSIAAVCAGILGHRSLEFLYILTIGADLLGAVVSLFMVEKPRDTRQVWSKAGAAGTGTTGAGTTGTGTTGTGTTGTGAIGTGATRTEATRIEANTKGLLSDLANLVKTLRKGDLRRLLVLWGIVSALVTSIKFYGQSFLKESMIPLFVIGAADTTANLLAIPPTRNAHKIEKRLGQIRTLSVGSLLVPLLVIFMALVPAKNGTLLCQAGLVILYLGLTVLNETLYPVFSSAVNSRVDSRNRAAVLSSGSMLFSIFMMAIFPAVGFLGDRAGLGPGMVISALFTGAVAALILTIRHFAE